MVATVGKRNQGSVSHPGDECCSCCFSRCSKPYRNYELTLLIYGEGVDGVFQKRKKENNKNKKGWVEVRMNGVEGQIFVVPYHTPL